VHGRFDGQVDVLFFVYDLDSIQDIRQLVGAKFAIDRRPDNLNDFTNIFCLT